MKKVLVLMSTYNGEKYLRDQLDSIFAQRNVKVDVLVRDDGSKDSTTEILKEYSKNYGLNFIEGKNINWMHSFWQLVNIASNYDYYAFSDQDDIWDDDKLIKAVNMLSRYEDIPAIYCANQRLINQKSEIINSYEDKVDIDHFKAQDLLVWGNLFRGCTEVWNNKLQMYIINKRIEDIDEPHDAIIMLIALLIGKVTKENSDVMSYRQHGNNVLGIQGGYARISYIVNNIVGRNGMDKPFSRRVKKVYEYVGTDVKPELRKYVEQICNYDTSMINTTKLALSRQYPNITIKKRLQILMRKF